MCELKSTRYLEKDLKTVRAHNNLMLNPKEEICTGDKEGYKKAFSFLLYISLFCLNIFTITNSCTILGFLK